MPVGRLVPLLIVLACVGALASAYTAQYGFGLEPCVLCLYQRIPYAIAGVLAVAAFVITPHHRRTGIALVMLCGLAFLVEAGLAFYHVGVEQHWWQAVTACADPAAGADMTMEELRAQILSKPPKACDEITWTVFGQSITVYNVAAGLVLSVFSFTGARLMERRRGA